MNMVERFPSPFNEDHFISQMNILKLKSITARFRPLLTRIISYRKKEFKWIRK